MEKEGYFGEKLVLEATDMGLATCWIGTSYRRDRCSCDINKDEVLDIGIAKLHFELGAGSGKWPLGDSSYFERK